MKRRMWIVAVLGLLFAIAHVIFLVSNLSAGARWSAVGLNGSGMAVGLMVAVIFFRKAAASAQ